jgi:Tol biopolymer transport system component
MRRSMVVAAVLGFSLLALGLVGPTQATTPGDDGLIAFGADDGSGFEIYTIRSNGSNLHQLTHEDANAFRPDWSPDGRRITFQLEKPDGSSDIMIMNAGGSNQRDLTPSGYEELPAFTPDGHHLVFSCDCNPQGVFIMRDDGSDRHRITTHAFPFEGDTNAEVSPDGATVTFVRHKVSGELQALFAVDPDGSDVRRIVPYSLEVAIKHDWAPDGRQIVITTDADYPEGRSPNVATVRPDGTHLRMLTHYSGGLRGAFAGSYSPNGRWIVYRVENLERENYRLFKVHPDGSDRTLIAKLPFAPRGIDWGSRP